MRLPKLKIGNLIADLPIIQGGMGIGVSLSKLASAVANEGGIGVISAAQIGFREKDFEENPKSANIRALKKEIREAKKLSPKGIIGVNIMAASSEFEELVNASEEENIDLIICGAGLPTNLPSLVKNKNIKLIPIVSSGKAANIISKLWIKKYNYTPDAIIVEGPKAGGHLGFSREDLKDETKKLEVLIPEVLEAIKPYKTDEKPIPVIAAGGIYSGSDISKFIKLGASGVQMATRFVATNECDAHIDFKKAYVNAKESDINIVTSPVGMPGRAVINEFIKSLRENPPKVTKCYNCLKPCNPKTTPYCISKALINSVNGEISKGLVFCGSNAYKINKIVSVKELMKELIKESSIE
ncbi:NAD(P)H-dependent flavin oxidoreductase [Haloimpatiens sp. FM7315]|uniref:NAD(P)H-dependent flavin oxidoreductase n=1 Tax=Haloimpatiens sp. FM7315 TaxID=3298609 RepID=UPI0035A27115